MKDSKWLKKRFLKWGNTAEINNNTKISKINCNRSFEILTTTDNDDDDDDNDDDDDDDDDSNQVRNQKFFREREAS